MITGSGRGFCSGQALGSSVSADALAQEVGALVRRRYVPIITKIRGLPLPVVAAVNGAAAGAGFSLALAADLRVASEAAWFSCAFSGIGLVPDSGASFFLPRYVGLAKAIEMALTGRRVGAAEAATLGLVTYVYPAETFSQDYSTLAHHLAQGPTRAFALTKRALSEATDNSLSQQLELEAVLQQEAAETDDFHEGLSAFRNKRAPPICRPLKRRSCQTGSEAHQFHLVTKRVRVQTRLRVDTRPAVKRTWRPRRPKPARQH